MDARSWILGQVHVYCYLVSRGKPTADILVPKALVGDVLHEVEEVQGFGCRAFVEEGRNDDWRTIWIYQRPMMLDVIQAYREVSHHLPACLKFWLTGCLFGYDQSEIETAWKTR